MKIFDIFKREDPKKGKKYFDIATDYLGKGNWNKVFENISKSIKFNPMDSAAYYIRASYFMAMKNYSLALQDLNTAIEIKEYDFIYFLIGQVYEKLEKISEAINAYTKSTELNPKNINAYFNIAALQWKNSKVTEAITNLNKIIDLEPENAEAYSLRGYYKAFIKDFNSAINDIKKAILINPIESKYYFHLATTYMLMLNFDESRKFYQKASELGDERARAALNEIENKTLIKFEEIDAAVMPNVKENDAKLFLSNISPIDGFIFDGVKKPKTTLFYSLKHAFPAHSFGDAYLLSINVNEFNLLVENNPNRNMEYLIEGYVVGGLHLEYGGNLDGLKVDVKSWEN